MKTRPIALVFLATCAAGALATAADADPSARVGRISLVEGQVSFKPPMETFWTFATRNFPVAPGESFWTGGAGRVELQIGSMEAWLDSETELDVLDLDYGETRLALTQGSLDLRLWRVPRGGVRISTPAGRVFLSRAGVYRIDVGSPGENDGYTPVEVTVFDGAAEIPGRDGLVRIDGGEAALVYPGDEPDAIDVQDASIDDWARDREGRERRARNEAIELAGYGDLDGQGEFVQTPDYGAVWFPRAVPADWAPYRYGHWAYVQPWGWTWIDDQPWGFAPFHYGRWARINDRWGWVPPNRSAPEPVYAPALVAFIGGLSAGGGGAALGWIPLGPEEVYRPPYQVSNTYVRNVNITNVRETTITNVVVNNITVNQYRNAPAATVVRSDAFARGAPVQRALSAVPAAEIARATPMAAAARPPSPMPEARTGASARPDAGPARSEAVANAAPPPPAKLQVVRTALAAQPATAVKPPVIPGAPPPAPRPPGAPKPAMALIAPAQVSHPQAQGQRPPPPPQAVTAAAPAQSAAEPGARVTPLKEVAPKPALAARPNAVAPTPTPVRPPPQGPAPGQAAAVPTPGGANKAATDQARARDREMQQRQDQASAAQAADADRRKAEAQTRAADEARRQSQAAEAQRAAEAKAAQVQAEASAAAAARTRADADKAAAAATARQREAQAARAAAEAQSRAAAAAAQQQQQREASAKAAADAKAAQVQAEASAAAAARTRAEADKAAAAAARQREAQAARAAAEAQSRAEVAAAQQQQREARAKAAADKAKAEAAKKKPEEKPPSQPQP